MFSKIVNKIRQFFTNFRQNYPKVTKTISISGKLVKWGIVVGILGVLSVILYVRFGFFREVPSLAEMKKIQNPIASEVYSADGVLLGRYYIENRTNASINDIPQHVVDALVATEDVRYMEHAGVDFRSLMRVLFVTIIGRDESAGGGSTISQQLTKNIYGRKSMRYVGTPMNKVWEMIVARRLEKIYTKKEIIELYLNTVSFGEDVYGIETASERYFNTKPKNLRFQDGAVLVGMLKATTTYNPKNQPEKAKGRRNIVFDQMAKYEYLDTTTLDSLSNLPLEVDYKYISQSKGLAPHFREQLRLDLEKICGKLRQADGTSYDVYKDGLKIYTTIDSRMQQYAEKAVQTHMKSLQETFFNHWKNSKPWGKNETAIRAAMKQTNRYKRLKDEGFGEAEIELNFKTKTTIRIFTYDGEEEREITPWDSIAYYHQLLNTGFVAMNPKNGHLKAYVGSINYRHFPYDHVFSKRQVGSTFKPIVYAKALENGHSPCDYVANEKITYPEYQNWSPGNSDGRYGGYYSIKGGLTKSVNTVAVQLMMENGVSATETLAKEMGITTDLPNVPSIALGAADISLYEMLQVYGTFANRGKPIEPMYLTRIEDRHGKVLKSYENNVPKTNVISEMNADYMIEMMQSVVDTGTARRLRFRYGIKGDVAGKTGTTQNQTDGWFMGFTPNLVAGVWVGGFNRKIRFRSTALGQGANMALPIWGMFVSAVQNDEAFKNQHISYFTKIEDTLRADCALYSDYLINLNLNEEFDLLEEDELKDLENIKLKPPIEMTEDEVKQLDKLEKIQNKRERKEERVERREERKEKARDLKNKLKKALKKKKDRS
ncbi:MAG: transglycosylase domain-containing protein [Saprospiraceae bacterium]